MNGLVIVDKPAGMTSHDVVSIVKKTLGVKKAGHTGTLDPLATGVLPICLNEATKLAQFLTSDTKEYRATMFLGVETDTLDIEGQVLSRKTPNSDAGHIERVLAGFIGKTVQRPPAYSAVKYKGKALYKWARKGVVVDSPSRHVEIFRLDVEDVSLPYVTFTISCSAGTYIRSICDDAGRVLGCGACLAALRRLRSGDFHIDKAVPPRDAEALRNGMITMTGAVSHLSGLTISGHWAKRLKDGVKPAGDFFRDYDISFLVSGDMVTLISEEGRLVAIASVDSSPEGNGPLVKGFPCMRILRIFHDQ
ncbi:MAG: tRNA pseudouridine synthase B [Syntrophus sp. SKADARSKE-3]|nr:tRNA pseudouridine synthase B [Syntrophus sp. SKADARSKE-3]